MTLITISVMQNSDMRNKIKNVYYIIKTTSQTSAYNNMTIIQ